MKVHEGIVKGVNGYWIVRGSSLTWQRGNIRSATDDPLAWYEEVILDLCREITARDATSSAE